MRELILDASLPPGLAAELRARGRPARTATEMGLGGASDRAVAAACDAGDLVLVTTVAVEGATVAVVDAAAGPARREIVHRHAHEIARQRAGTLRRYGLRSSPIAV